MISVRNILTITKFESKVLWRNWFFRILAIAGLFFTFVFNMAAFSTVSDGRQHMISSSWGPPYASMILISIGLAAAVIFLASGIILKNKKIDTNEVFYVRPISNLEFVLGKAFSVFKLFFWLHVAFLVIIFIINITNPKMTVNPMAYVVYPMLMSFPTIVFATGLSFFLVTVIRNQPITIVLLLGVSGVILIYFHQKYYNIFDYMGFRVTLQASDMVGFTSLWEILMQRGMYVVAGIACLFATAFFIDRLPSKKSAKYISGLLALGVAVIAGFMFTSLWNKQQGIEEHRQAMIAINDTWTDVPNVDILANHIQLKHASNEIEVVARLSVKNNNSTPLDSIYFTLNPELIVSEVQVGGDPVPFKQERQVLSVKSAIQRNGETQVSISYRGKINQEVAHLEVDRKRYEEVDYSFIYAMEKEYAFLQPEYLLLTNDILWYPDTQIGYSKKSPIKERSNFVDFKLDVEVTGTSLPVTQGKMEKVTDNTYEFRPEYPLPQLALAIGNYEKKSITVDSVEYSIYHYPGHDYFASYFDELGDTLNVLITDLVNAYEHDQKLSYPFNRLQLVEVPSQFFAYDKIYQSGQARTQPEMILVPEKGGDIRDFDINRQFTNMDRQAREQNKVMEDKEKQASVFNTVMKKVLTRQISDRWFLDGRNSDEENLSVYSNFYAFNSGVVSDEWMLLNQGIAAYLSTEETSTRNDYSRNLNGISFTEEVNQLMRETNIMEILTQEIEFNQIQKSVTLKSEYLFAYLGQLIGEEVFKAFLTNWIQTHRHQVTMYDDFRQAISATFNLDVDPIIRQVYFDTDQPSFLIDNNEEYELLDGDRKRYQVKFNVKNTGSNDGVIKVNFTAQNETTGWGFFRERNDEVASDEPGYLSLIKAGQTKQFGFVLDNPPSEYTVNTLVSKNIPSIVYIFPGQLETREKARPFEGERVLEESNDDELYEVIVDNEDDGFSTFSPIKDTYLKSYLDERNPSDQKYFGVWNRSYSKWLATTGSSFHGGHVRSAHFTRAGKGEKTCEWTPELEEEGFYDLYTYMIGKNQNQYNGSVNEGRTFTYHYTINHGDGEDKIDFNVTNAENGWNYLGSYYFTKEGGSVVLTDECDLRSVYADAIKWVKQ